MKKFAFLDFDWTLLNENSDFSILKDDAECYSELMAWVNNKKNDKPSDTNQFTDLMNKLLNRMLDKGNTIDTLKSILCNMTISPYLSLFLNTLKKYEYEIHIVSDANTFFINTILEHHNLLNLIDNIHTNPCIMDGDRLSIYRYSSNNKHSISIPHKCDICSLNMCKGDIINKTIQDSTQDISNIHVIYAGDGLNDLCPILTLSPVLKSRLYACPRDEYSLYKKLKENNNKLKIKIESEGVCLIPWKDLNILNNFIINNDTHTHTHKES
eukprot:GHVR01074315.1.p1 GENE.GHVR01074315.1~~GHVR01074315.1.p1  ORF type:complete len:278 (+),score=72.43 GHVR01074315.1:28-834(+)